MPVLLALVLFACPRPAGAETLYVGITVAAELSGSIPGIDALQAGAGTLFTREYGRFSDISFEPAPPAAGASEPDPTAAVTLSPQAGGVEVSTKFARGGVTRSLSSSVPPGAPASLVSTITADIAFLFFSSREVSAGEFTAFPLEPPPSLLATLQTDTLKVLTGWDTSELEPIALAGSGGRITVCFPHRFLTLDPLFRITADTIRDLNAQAGSGQEPLLLSGIAAGRSDDLLLLSESEGAVVRVDPLLGTRQIRAAPGLAGTSGRRLDPDTLAVLSNAGGSAHIVLFGARPSGSRALPVLASYASALSSDPEGNLWVWDAGERRVRILTAAGREVFTIRPMIKASTMQLPQQLEVYADGSFLLGGSAEVWKFDNTGIPIWRMSRIPGRPGEQLPPSFALAAHDADGSFTLLDAPSRRLMTFGPGTEPGAGAVSAAGAESAAGTGEDMAALLARLDARRPADVQEAGDLASRAGLFLMAWQFGDLLARRGGPENDREAARRLILRDKSRLYAELADSMLRAQLFQGADGAYLRAGEAARELAAAAPDDDAAARLREDIASKRQDVRTALSRVSDVRIVSAAAGVAHEGGCALSLTLMLRVRNNAAVSLAKLRVRAGLPSLTHAQARADVDALFPADERDLEFKLQLDAPPPLSAFQPDGVPAVFLVTYEKGGKGFTVPDSLAVSVVNVAAAEPLANALACRAEKGDQLVAGLADGLLDTGGAENGAAGPLASLAAILDSLGSVRRFAAGAGAEAAGAEAAGAEAAGAEAAGAAGAGAAGAGMARAGMARAEAARDEGAGVRPALRAFSPDEGDWALLSLSVIDSLGLPAGLMSWPDRVLALVDTGIPLPGAASSVPGLDRYSAVLGALSRDGRLCLPLSGRVSPDASSTTAWSVVDALEVCRERAVNTATVSWLGPAVNASRDGLPVPVPFPFVPPCPPVRPSGGALRNEMIKALEKTK